MTALVSPVTAPRAWGSQALALGGALALHLLVAALLLGVQGQAEIPSAVPRVMTTQLISLPPAIPEAEPVVAAAPEPVAVPTPVEPVPLPRPQLKPAPKPAPKPELAKADMALKRKALEVEQRKVQEELQRLALQRLEEQRQAREIEARQQALAAQHAKAAAQQAAQQARAAEEAASRQYLPIVKSAPDYPARALDKGIQGSCTVAYRVNERGLIEDPKALDDCHPLFVRPSLQAAKKFRYQPRVVNGQVVAVSQVKNTFHYQIQ